MSGSLLAACLWVLSATAAALAPRWIHWPAAQALIVAGIPLLGWVTWQNGPFWGLLCLAGGASILRWPLIHLARRLRG